MKKRLFGLVYLLLGMAAGTLAASHWTVNPHDFQYDMTVYLQIASVEQSNYEVAAFCLNECRGVGKLLTAEDGTKVFQLRVRSNVASGETISFRVYNKSTGKEYAVTNTITFLSQSIEGEPSSPLQLDVIFDYIKGDANGDGIVAIADAVAIANYIFDHPSTSFNETAADVNGDGKITISDAVSVVNIILNNGGGASAAPAMKAQ